MSYTRNDANIRCPFFKHESEKSILCEGFTRDSVLLTKFPDEKKKITYINRYCVRCTGGDCYLARSQFARYEQAENETKKSRR